MTLAIPQTEPKEAVAGDSWRWQRWFSDYPPSDGWTLTYYFRGVEEIDVSATALPDQNGYNITVPAADTARLDPGAYDWAAIVTKSATSERKTVAHGLTIVTPDFSQLSAGDLVTHEERMVKALEAVIEGRIPDDVQFQIIGGRQIQMIPILELRQLLEYYREKVRRRRAGGRTPPFVVTFR